MRKLPAPLKLAVGTLGGAVVAIGVVVITASAMGFDLTAAHPASSAATAVTAAPSPSPVPSAGAGQASPAVRAVAQATVQAEAQALGVTPRALSAALRQGSTLHQVATGRGVSPAVFQAGFAKGLTALLDQDVKQGTLTATQEQAALRRLGARLPPNWDRAAARAPTPAPSPT
jgi:membrane-bound lytic murein transglycosylase B